MGESKVQEEEFESFVDEEPIEPLAINKYDQYSLRGGMDDTIVKLLGERGYKEDEKLMDYKIFVCII